ncbi:MAG: rRNA maturation RNase YbeY [Desulfovibrio sp.]|jgi:probable rRNA maturation factor|nr:rRNA maturation RNase YbeY [Desulfovibrio sp.]
MPADVFARPRAGVWKLPFARPELRSLLSAMLAAAGTPEAAVELLLVNDADMEHLQQRHLRRPGPTNILSFPSGNASLGSLVLAPETVCRECFLYGQEPAGYVRRLLAHGLAHLLGRNHGPEMDRLTALLEQSTRET